MSHDSLRIRCTVGFLASLFVALATSVPVNAQEPSTEGIFSEPPAIERTVVFADRRQGNGEFTNGFYPDLWNMVPGAGWISAGPGFRHWYAKDQVFVDASTAVSWRGYKTLQGRFELPALAHSRLAIGSQFRWQDLTQMSFFGSGPASVPSNESQYRFRSHSLVGYATVRPVESVALGGQIGWLRPSVLSRAGWFQGDSLDTRRVFPSNPVFAFTDQPTFIQREVSVTADTRDFPRHPSSGGLYRAAAATFTDAMDVFSFTRYEAEVAQFVPLAGSRFVLAARGWLVASDTDLDQTVPFYLQPSLGGENTLRSYPDYRFHDRNMLVVNAEGRIALTAHLESAVFVDMGNVAARVTELNFDKRSYGAGLRLHTRRQTFARVDVARGGEGWRLLLRVADPLDLARLSRPALLAPFVP